MSGFKISKPRLPVDAVEGFAAKAEEPKKDVLDAPILEPAGLTTKPSPVAVSPVKPLANTAVNLASLDPNAKPTKGLRLDLNEWQLEALRQIAQRDERSMQYVLQKLLKSWIPEELTKKG